ncbi:MAG: ketosynthase [Gammaproteobacteria bacterium]|nr:ketosynthase [Gammaproteobacteria bacterium]
MNAAAPAAPQPPAGSFVLAVEIALAIGYGVLAHLASARGSDLLALMALLVLVLLVLASPLAARRAGAWLALPLLAGGCWALYRAGHAPLPLLLVPVAFIGLVAWMFGRTLRPWRLPLITRVVTVLDDTPAERLEPAVLRYARGVTLGWTLLLLVLGAVNLALAMIATPDGLLAQLGLQPPVAITRTQWSWFANLFNYGIIAAFFVAEFQLRKRRFPGRYPSFAGFLRRLGALGPAFWRDQLR